MPSEKRKAGGVLIVDDDLFQVDPITRRLRLLGIDVFEAETLRQAIDILTAHAEKISVAVVDLMIEPSKDDPFPPEETGHGVSAGFAMVKHIKSNWPNTRLTLLSAHRISGAAAQWCSENKVPYFSKMRYEELITFILRRLKIERRWPSIGKIAAATVFGISFLSALIGLVTFFTGTGNIQELIQRVTSTIFR